MAEDSEYIKEEVKRLEKRIDKQDTLLERISATLQEIALANRDFENFQTTMERRFDEISSKINEVYDHPRKNWNNAVWAIVSTVIAAIALFLIAPLINK